MALENKPVAAQEPKAAHAAISSANAALDGSGSIAEVVAIGPRGGILTALVVRPAATVAATRVVAWLSLDGGTTWRQLLSGTLAAWTSGTGSSGEPLTLVDPADPDDIHPLPANAKVGLTIAVANAVHVAAAWQEFADRS